MRSLQLGDPFPVKEIHWRVGATTQDKTKGMALAFIDARHVMERLDAVVGPNNWRSSYRFEGKRTICRLEIYDAEKGEWIFKEDGAGDTDIEGEKGGMSDALKRAGVTFNIGRYLYRVDAVWVEVQPAGKSFKIKPSEYKKLHAALNAQDAGKQGVETDDTDARGKVSAIPKPDPSAMVEPNGNLPARDLIMRCMKKRCVTLGLDEGGAGTIVNSILTVGMSLKRDQATLESNLDAILEQIEAYEPTA
jgi:hypothetical protein